MIRAVALFLISLTIISHSGPLKRTMKEERGFYLIHFVLPYNPIILFRGLIKRRTHAFVHVVHAFIVRLHSRGNNE